MNQTIPFVRPFRRLAILLAALLFSTLALQAQETLKPAASAQPDTVRQRALAEKSGLRLVAIDFCEWIDQAGAATQSPFLNAPAFGQVTWMRLLAALAILAGAGLLSGWLIWSIRRHAGKLESDEHQSWLHLVLAALRKPMALLLWLVGGFFSAALLIERIETTSTRSLLFSFLTSVAYAGRIVLIFWLIFRLMTAVQKRLRQWAEKRGGVLENVLLPIIGQALRIIVPMIAFVLLLPLMDLPADWAWVTGKFIGMLIIGGLSFLIIRAANLSEKSLLRLHRLDVADNLQARKIYTQVSVTRKIVVVLVTVLGIASILMLFDPLRRLGSSILASAGIAGIILGFAAQRTLGNLLAGIQIALTQPIRIDDVVIVEGEWGRIEEINLTYVVVNIWDLRRLVVPITYFIEKPFQNWTRTSANLLGTIFLYVDYNVPLDAVRKELRRLCEANRENGLWDGSVCGLQVTDCRDSLIELRCLASSPDASKSFDLRCELREKLILFLRENYPESLPRVRAEFQQVRREPEPVRPVSSGEQRAGKASEVGPKLAGIEASTDLEKPSS
jgi:small-conductance mechanosensitive channel